MNYFHMIKMAEQSNRVHAAGHKVASHPLSRADKAAMSDLYFNGGTVYEGTFEGAEVVGEWSREMTWKHTEYFHVVRPHSNCKRALPLPWVTPWDRTTRRAHTAWMRDFKARVAKEGGKNV
jgi:hypothetical protein